MLHSISFFLVLLLFSFITIENKAFSPLEFLQHLQQQQHLDFQPQESPQQNQVPMQQPPPQLPRQQPQGQPTPQPLTQEEPPKEQFKPFCGKSPLTLKGCFTFIDETYNEKIPHFRVYFAGKETISDDDGFFSLPVDEDQLHKFKLIITKTFCQDFDKFNTIKNQRVFSSKNYKYYSFKKNNWQGTWVQHEKQLNKKKFIIPQNTIIVLVDPKYVDHLEQWHINLTNNFITLPKIVLKKEVRLKPIDRAAAKSLLTSLDASIFHEEVRGVVKKPSPKIKMTLVQ